MDGPRRKFQNCAISSKLTLRPVTHAAAVTAAAAAAAAVTADDAAPAAMMPKSRY